MVEIKEKIDDGIFASQLSMPNDFVITKLKFWRAYCKGVGAVCENL